MSRNNLILVIRDRRRPRHRFYVTHAECADTQWSTEYARTVADAGARFVTSRGRALCMAHDLQKNLRTEYGVQELDLSHG